MDNDTRFPSRPDSDLWDGDPRDGDPWEDEREVAPVLELDAVQRTELAAAVQAGLCRDGCDNTLRAAQRWATGAGLRWAPLQEQLAGNGGFCDCEVLVNVLPPPTEPD